MEYGIEDLREDFDDFMKGEKSNLAVKSSAISLLEVAKSTGDTDLVGEIEDMLMELEFSIEENKCDCLRKDSSC